ncbi:Beta-lactamase-like protein [Macrophomina phaseolina MS6]|uniref:Beta-lactamase-like protein n=1 Tax=Macrophomina phaseolina (strain MS6) TaxID=1126212 RepID=K2RFL2_MACPH|nr:Beta-lactamase-like protein [Macrophomina phaseolina MS6]
MEADEGWFKRGGGSTTASNAKKISERRELVIVSALIEHPTEGLILFETGAGKDYLKNWGAPLNDIFAQANYDPDQELESQIAKTGHEISDVTAVIMGHLHLDHAGGLEYFRGTDVPIYVHEKELKHAFYSVASKSDLGVYLPQHLTFDLNWTPFHGDSLEIAQGLILRHAPGHTPGLCILQANLKDSGTWIFTTDQYHVRENYEASHPQGWLARDHDDWVRSHQMVRMLQRRTGARLVLGHCKETFNKYKHAPHAYT